MRRSAGGGRFFCRCLTALLFLAAPLLTAQPPPDWVDNPRAVYPAAEYLSAVGEGTSRTEAQNNALAALARIFGARVQLDARSRRRYQTGGGAAESSAQIDARVSADEQLINSDIAENRQVGNKHYALAVIPIAPTVLLLQQKIAAGDQTVDALYRKAMDDPDPIYQYSFINMARIIAQENETRKNQLQVLAPGLSLNDGISVSRLLAEERRIVATLTFKVEAADDDDSLTAGALANSLGELGLRVARRRAAYLLRAQAPVFSGRGGHGGRVFTDARLRVALIDAGGAELASFAFQARAMGADSAAAATLGRQLLLQQIEAGFAERFDAFLNELLAE